MSRAVTLAASVPIEPAFEYTTTVHIAKADVPLIVEALRDIDEAGRLTTREQGEALVAHSRSRNSPTHHLFEWDDAKAAEVQRLERAQTLIRSVRIVFADRPKVEMRAFPVVTIDGKRGYFPMVEVMKRPNLIQSLVEQARADAALWMRRYEHLRDRAELAGVFAAMGRFVSSKKRKTKR